MPVTRRQFLAHASTFGAVAPLGLMPNSLFAASSSRPLPPELNGEQPLPDLLPRSALPRFRLDVESTQQRGKIILAGGKSLRKSPSGGIIEIPAGADISVKRLVVAIRKSWRYRNGARIILKGEKGKRPILRTSNNKGIVRFANSARVKASLELENLILEAGPRDNCVRAAQVHLLRLDNVKITGGKNGVSLSSLPTTVAMVDCEVSHCGKGNGLSHGFYGGYNKRVVIRNCRFHSARGPGHAFKCYAASIDIRDSLFASWLDTQDRDAGFYGELPPIDIGAWSNSVIANNTIIRRGPARRTAIDYRNRQYTKGFADYIPDGWGTQIIDPSLIDNRDPGNSYLFHHILSQNRFINGILPDGSTDPAIKAKPGHAIRNNGTAPWASGGKTDPISPSSQLSNWARHNERAIIWSHKNIFEGVPFDKNFETTPHEQPSGYAPIRQVQGLPPHLKARLL